MELPLTAKNSNHKYEYFFNEGNKQKPRQIDRTEIEKETGCVYQRDNR